MDYYKNFNNLTKQFGLFLNKTPLFGKNVVCLDDPSIIKLIKKSTKQNFLTYGFNGKADFVPTNLVYKNMKIYFDLKVNLKKKFTIKCIALNLMGQHNVLNATAAIIVSITLGISTKKIKKTLENFLGVQRRLTKVYQNKDRIIFDDYAHHPTEIAAVLNACKKNFNKNKIISVFQPHRFSRVQSLYNKFTVCFTDSDLVVLCPVYAAGEKNISFDLEKFGKKIAKNSKTEVIIVKDEKNLDIFLQKNYSNKEVVIAMGAGNISQWIRSISKKLKNAKN
jgi:UDP-N-acetylmuramate--alanine ligase